MQIWEIYYVEWEGAGGEGRGKKNISRYKRWGRLQPPNPPCTQVKNPEHKPGAAFLFCSPAARYPPDPPGPAAPFAAASSGDSPRTAAASQLGSSNLSPCAHRLTFSFAALLWRFQNPPSRKKTQPTPLAKGAQTSAKLHPNPTDRDQ